MREIDKIIIHCSATKANQMFSTGEIRRWHMSDNGWSDIGYHWVIERNGFLGKGRNEEIIGAHCRGQNSGSLGICLVGGLDVKGRPEDNFTEDQYRTLKILLREKCNKYDIHEDEIYPHNYFDKRKSCPCFEVEKFVLDSFFVKQVKKESKVKKFLRSLLCMKKN